MTIFKTAPHMKLEKYLTPKERMELAIKRNFHWIILLMGIMMMVTMVLVAFLFVGATESGIVYNQGGIL